MTMTNREIVAATQVRVDDLRELTRAGLVNREGYFYPSVHYPPITMYEPIHPDDFLAGYAPPPGNRMSVYVHIPFCETRCVFCHYPVVTGVTPAGKDHYLRMLEREMDLWFEHLDIDRIQATSVLVAGGTPTAMSVEQFRHFHRFFTARVDLASCTQLAYDVHPRTLLGDEGAERLRIMRDHGSDRLTIGIQSFDEELLQQMNRGQTRQESIDSIEACRRAGYEDICIEFIYGYPNQTMESWLADLRLAIELGVDEIQIYRLKIEPYGDEAGPILRMYREGNARFVSAEDTIHMKQAAILLLDEHGYRETLTRVFSRKKEFYSHYASDQCCRLIDQVGFGMSAFSSLRDRFCINPDTMDEYYDHIDAGRIPVNRGLVRSEDENRRWNVILPLKNMKVVRAEFAATCGLDVADVFPRELETLTRHGLVDVNERRVKLTAKGRFFADEICQQFHTERFMPHPRERYAEGPLNPYRSCEGC